MIKIEKNNKKNCDFLLIFKNYKVDLKDLKERVKETLDSILYDNKIFSNNKILTSNTFLKKKKKTSNILRAKYIRLITHRCCSVFSHKFNEEIDPLKDITILKTLASKIFSPKLLPAQKSIAFW